MESDVFTEVEINSNIFAFQPVREERQQSSGDPVQRQFPVRQGVFVKQDIGWPTIIRVKPQQLLNNFPRWNIRVKLCLGE